MYSRKFFALAVITVLFGSVQEAAAQRVNYPYRGDLHYPGYVDLNED